MQGSAGAVAQASGDCHIGLAAPARGRTLPRMKSRPVDPRHLDVEAFATEGGTLAGEWPLPMLDRVGDAAHPDARPDASELVRWHVDGERREVRGAAPQTWLHLRADTRLALVCQRCLGPVTVPVETGRSFLFVAGEDAAASLDAESDDDVLTLEPALDLKSLVEDELLLALPLVPRHEVCPQPLPVPADTEALADERPNPFAALAALKRGGSSDAH